MKTPERTKAAAARWLSNHLIAIVTGEEPGNWSTPLLAPTGSDLARRWDAARAWALDWRAHADLLPAGALSWENRRLAGATQPMPCRLQLTDAEAVAAWAGPDSVERLTRAYYRWGTITKQFSDTAVPSILKRVLSWDHADFNILVTTAIWLRDQPVTTDTYTPRQIPVPGLHSKWLDLATRRDLVARLAGRSVLHVTGRPAQARVRLLDPAMPPTSPRNAVITAGEPIGLPYTPSLVLIVENRDTFFYFPPVIPNGLVVLGDGYAVTTLTAVALEALGLGQLVYWGDIDTAGLTMVARLRNQGHQVTTILMDSSTYTEYAQFGTSVDHNGVPIRADGQPPPYGLTTAEAQLYQTLNDPRYQGHRRVEQERIPLPVAVKNLLHVVRN